MSPHNQYIAGREPPLKRDRVLSNPFLLPLGVVSFVTGILVLITIVLPFEVSRSLSEIHIAAQLAIAIPLTIGAPVSLAGCLGIKGRRSRANLRSVESSGDVMVGAGWASYGLSVSLNGNAFAILTAGLALAVAAGYALRVCALLVSDRRARQINRVARGEMTEG